jgi:hypothetical protein
VVDDPNAGGRITQGFIESMCVHGISPPPPGATRPPRLQGGGARLALKFGSKLSSDRRFVDPESTVFAASRSLAGELGSAGKGADTWAHGIPLN